MAKLVDILIMVLSKYVKSLYVALILSELSAVYWRRIVGSDQLLLLLIIATIMFKYAVTT